MLPRFTPPTVIAMFAWPGRSRSSPRHRKAPLPPHGQVTPKTTAASFATFPPPNGLGSDAILRHVVDLRRRRLPAPLPGACLGERWVLDTYRFSDRHRRRSYDLDGGGRRATRPLACWQPRLPDRTGGNDAVGTDPGKYSFSGRRRADAPFRWPI